MTAYSMTISNSMRFFGGGPASQWNQYNWNAFKFGDGTADIPTDIVHLTGTNLNIATSVIKAVTHKIMESVAAISDIAKSPTKLLSNAAVMTGAPSQETLLDGSNYSYVFADRATNAEDRDFTQYASGTAASSPWAQAGATTTGWS